LKKKMQVQETTADRRGMATKRQKGVEGEDVSFF
jgi:hypothetical protein